MNCIYYDIKHSFLDEKNSRQNLECSQLLNWYKNFIYKHLKWMQMLFMLLYSWELGGKMFKKREKNALRNEFKSLWNAFHILHSRNWKNKGINF